MSDLRLQGFAARAETLCEGGRRECRARATGVGIAPEWRHATHDGGPMTGPAATRPPLPPFTSVSAVQKVRAAEDGWNSRNAEAVALAYSPQSRWRNRSEFVTGREQIVAFLRRKWARELDYRLIKELWAFQDDRIAVRFAYEWHDDAGTWFRSFGNENWQFDEHGLMTMRHASINDLPIREEERKFHWPLGRRPEDHPGLSSFGF